jgi:hypothetical protein
MSPRADPSATPLVVRIVGPGGDFDTTDWARHFPGGCLDQGDVRFVFGGSGESDVVIALGYSKTDVRVRVRLGGVWAWHMEPHLPRPYSSCFDLVFSHLDRPDEKRFVTAPPILDWWVGKSYDELAAMAPLPKTHTMSAIASMRAHIDGHRKRLEFIERVQKEVPQVDLFGRGRAHALGDKWEGLAPYKYTLAIENSSMPHYWTEKISDAFLAYSVPLYFGAPNIGDYFPDGSYIWLPMDDPERAIEVITHTLENDDYDKRVAALTEARNALLTQHSLVARVSAEVTQRRGQLLAAPRRGRTVHGRRITPNGWLRGAGVRKNLGMQTRRVIRVVKGK